MPVSRRKRDGAPNGRARGVAAPTAFADGEEDSFEAAVGFFPEDMQESAQHSARPARAMPDLPSLSVPLLPSERCSFCASVPVSAELQRVFGLAVCRACSYARLSFVTKTDARNNFLLTEDDLAALPHLERRNPHRTAWNDMHLFLRTDIERVAVARYGSLEAAAALKAERLVARHNKRVAAIQKDVRSRKKQIFQMGAAAPHRHHFVAKNGRGRCTCGMEIELDEIATRRDTDKSKPGNDT